METLSKVSVVLTRFSNLESKRRPFEGKWQEIANYILPTDEDFYTTNYFGYRVRTERYDNTAEKACEDLASGLQGYLTSPSDRWFELTLDNPRVLEKDLAARAHIQYIEDLMYHVFQSPLMKFYPNTHELYIDVSGIGTGVMLIEEKIDQALIRYKTIPLSECYIDENAFGTVDTLFRKFSYSARQVLQLFGNNIPLKEKAELEERVLKKPNEEIELIHGVFPREDFDKTKWDNKNMPFCSIYIWKEKKIILNESGYREFPYVVPRWYTKSRKVYGRSPGFGALPDTKVLNEMCKTTLKGAQKSVDPPMQAPDDGFMTKIDIRPGKVNYYRAGLGDNQVIKPIQSGANVQIGLEMEERRRVAIKTRFYNDLMQEDKRAEMSATESLQREEARMRLMAPQLGRLHVEFLGPLLLRTYNILKRSGLIPEAPQSIKGRIIKPNYVSPLARAQKMVQATHVQRMFEQIGQYAQIAPEMFDKIDSDGLVNWLTYLHGAPVQILRTDDAVAQLRKARQEQTQQAQGIALAEQGSKALANLSKAQEVMGNAN